MLATNNLKISHNCCTACWQCVASYLALATLDSQAPPPHPAPPLPAHNILTCLQPSTDFCHPKQIHLEYPLQTQHAFQTPRAHEHRDHLDQGVWPSWKNAHTQFMRVCSCAGEAS